MQSGFVMVFCNMLEKNWRQQWDNTPDDLGTYIMKDLVQFNLILQTFYFKNAPSSCTFVYLCQGANDL